MKFGKIKATELASIDFTFPADQAVNQEILGGTARQHVQVYVGCPIWGNKQWLGRIYPVQAKEKDFLKYYSQQFNTIELNSTHYHIPAPNTVARWKETVPTHFQFCPKIPQEISHQQLLEGKAQKLSYIFCENLRALEENLGMAFMQLPPYFEPKHQAYLSRFLDEFPEEMPLAIEFRHPSWFTQEQKALEGIQKQLTSQQIALVITDVAGRRDVFHQFLSSKTAVVRFVGNSLHKTDYMRLDAWVQRFKSWLLQGLERIYFFVHQPDNDFSPELCAYFIQEMNQHCGLNIAEPVISKQYVQGNLF